MPLSEDYELTHHKGPQETVTKAIVDFIGKNPAVNGDMQADIMLQDHQRGFDVEQNAIAAQVALRTHGDRMPEAVRAKLQGAIDTVMTKVEYHKGPQDPVTAGIVDFVSRNPVINADIQASILEDDHQRGMDVVQNARGAQAALEEVGDKIPEATRNRLRKIVDDILGQ
jgi:hypothetical protein